MKCDQQEKMNIGMLIDKANWYYARLKEQLNPKVES